MAEQRPIRLSQHPAAHSRGAHGTTAVQAVLIPRKWGLSDRDAGEWVIKHTGHVPLKVHTTAEFQRFRIVEPEHFTHFITIKRPRGMRLVVGFY